MKGKKIVIVVVILAIAAVVCGFLIKHFAGGKESASTVKVQSVSSVNAAGGVGLNRYSGVVESQKTEKVEFDTEKTLKECYVNVDDHVKKGDKLFAYDATSMELDMQQKQLDVEKLQATINNDTEQIATLTKQMNEAAASDKLEYSSQIMELQAAVAQAQYDIKTAQAAIEKMKNQIANTTVTAPMDGVVTKIEDPLAMSDGKTYMTITKEGQYRVKTTITEQNIGEISEGQSVLLRSRVDEDATWTGMIAQIDTKPQTNNDSSSGESATKYTFYVELDSVDGLILGQHLTVEANLAKDLPKSGIWITSGWIVEEDGNHYVWASTSGDGTLQKRKVSLGSYIDTLDLYEITEGLSNSDYLAWPLDDCVEGAKVMVSQSTGAENAIGSDVEGADTIIDRSVTEENTEIQSAFGDDVKMTYNEDGSISVEQ